jgi:hypothetical protein
VVAVVLSLELLELAVLAVAAMVKMQMLLRV